MRARLYNFDGEPIDLIEWALLFEARPDNLVRWRIGYDLIEIPEGVVEVSTVWDGMDHNFEAILAGDETAPALIFETMVRSPEGEELYRYATEEQALEGHKYWVEWANLYAGVMS